jgi:hypothetical protein
MKTPMLDLLFDPTALASASLAVSSTFSVAMGLEKWGRWRKKSPARQAELDSLVSVAKLWRIDHAKKLQHPFHYLLYAREH